MSYQREHAVIFAENMSE